jgi:hypothetical protein
MARKKKDTATENEDVVVEEESVTDENGIEQVSLEEETKSVPEEVLLELKLLEEEESQAEGESGIISLDPYEVRPAKTGIFVEKLGSDSIFETDDGQKWAIPYKAEHASLKAGDAYTF